MKAVSLILAIGLVVGAACLGSLLGLWVREMKAEEVRQMKLGAERVCKQIRAGGFAF